MNIKIVALLADVFGVKESQICPELTKKDVGSWDSLKQMDLVMTLEREYEIVLEIQDIQKMASVADILNILKSKGVDVGH